MVVTCSFSNRRAASLRALNTFECNLARSLLRFCRAVALLVIRLVVERIEFGGGKRYDASVTSKGSRGCVPVTAK